MSGAVWHREGATSGPVNQCTTDTGRIFTVLRQGNKWAIGYTTRSNPDDWARTLLGYRFRTATEARAKVNELVTRLSAPDIHGPGQLSSLTMEMVEGLPSRVTFDV